MEFCAEDNRMKVLKKAQPKNIDLKINVCFGGSDIIGKTSLIKRLAGDKFDQTTHSTIGYVYWKLSKTINGKTVELTLWDTPGHKRLWPLI